MRLESSSLVLSTRASNSSRTRTSSARTLISMPTSGLSLGLCCQVRYSAVCLLWILSLTPHVCAGVGVSAGYPVIQTNSTSWSEITILMRFENVTRSNSEVVVCHVLPRNASVMWNEYGLSDPLPLVSYQALFAVETVIPIVIYTGATNMTNTDIYCEWQDTNSVWQRSAVIQPSLGFVPGYPYALPGNFSASSVITVQVKFGRETSMPFNATFLCWSFPRNSVCVCACVYQWVMPFVLSLYLCRRPTTSQIRITRTIYRVCRRLVFYRNRPRLSLPQSPPHTSPGTVKPKLCSTSLSTLRLTTRHAHASPVHTWTLWRTGSSPITLVSTTMTVGLFPFCNIRSTPAVPDNKPVLHTPMLPQTAYEEFFFNSTIPSNVFVDPDGLPLVYTATAIDWSTGLSVPFPAWLNFNATNQLSACACFLILPSDMSVRILSGRSMGLLISLMSAPTPSVWMCLIPLEPQCLDTSTLLLWVSLAVLLLLPYTSMHCLPSSHRSHPPNRSYVCISVDTKLVRWALDSERHVFRSCAQ